jgi:organic hydroperoxide reductase OsmC/OhrA
MSQHSAKIDWKFQGGEFKKGKYSREHRWYFDGGIEVAASPTPAVIPVPFSNPACVDPEEAFVASIASCHMLTFLFVAQKAGLELLSYEDAAVGTLTKNEKGVPWISSVLLSPMIAWSDGSQPTQERLAELHDKAHELCFIANSVKTSVTVAAPAHDLYPASTSSTTS